MPTTSPQPPDLYSPPLILSSEVYGKEGDKNKSGERTALHVDTAKLSLQCNGSTPSPTSAAGRLQGYSYSYAVSAALWYTLGYKIAIPAFILQNLAVYALAKENNPGKNSFPIEEIKYAYDNMTVAALIKAGRVPADATVWTMRRSEKLSTGSAPKVSFELYGQSAPRELHQVLPYLF